MKFTIDDDQQFLTYNSANGKVLMTLRSDNVEKMIGTIVTDENCKVFFCKKEPFTFKKIKGFSFNFAILPYIDRIDLFSIKENMVYRIMQAVALKQGEVLYRNHSRFEPQMFIPITKFMKFQYIEGTKEWKPI